MSCCPIESAALSGLEPVSAVRIEAWVLHHRVRTDRVIRSHAGVHDTSNFITVRASDAAGHVGLGEGATTAAWSGEDASSSKQMIDETLAPALVDRAFGHPAEADALMARMGEGWPFTRAGVSMALWDLWGRANRRALGEVVGDRPLAESLPTRASVGAYDAENTVRIAAVFVEAGVTTLKFKVGVPGVDDVGRLRACRERFGPDLRFTVDGNGAYEDADTAVQAIESWLPFGIELVEQPTPRRPLELMAAVRRRVPVPILADESIFTPGHLDEALDLEAMDMVSLYPGKHGGIGPTLAMAGKAQRAGKACVIGSNLETELGQAATATIAACCSAFPCEEVVGDFPAALFYERSPLAEPAGLRDGRVPVPRGHGFGVELAASKEADQGEPT